MGFLPDEVDKGGAPELVRKRPALCLGETHQRCLDGEGDLRAQTDGRLKGLQCLVPAVRIARIVGLAHAADQHVQAPAMPERRRIDEEHQVAPRNEGGGEAGLGHDDFGLGRQRRIADRPEAGDIDHMIGTEACGPVRKALGNGRADALPALEFDAVPLAVVEADGIHAGVAVQSVARQVVESWPPENKTKAPAGSAAGDDAMDCCLQIGPKTRGRASWTYTPSRSRPPRL
ncbi:hypothetical protein AUC70_06820 [Methyloceanibacter stevinii]|uniref:Uncharacterized protein n=1 Tax=Methyloceanibacter stevinii TaxID=1774970 RepID=A0A1E3VM39_9HYPH|nr:hypothetical protein AUC70_06820 [Methyloceanibacter stevinii]